MFWTPSVIKWALEERLCFIYPTCLSNDGDTKDNTGVLTTTQTSIGKAKLSAWLCVCRYTHYRSANPKYCPLMPSVPEIILLLVRLCKTIALTFQFLYVKEIYTEYQSSQTRVLCESEYHNLHL